MSAVTRESPEQFRVHLGELARVKRGRPVEVDPYLIARAVAAVMAECTVRAASGQRLLWNDYRVILARRDFDRIRPLASALERDLDQALAEEARRHAAVMAGALRCSVVFDEAGELPAGEAVVRVAFVPTERLPAARQGEMTVRFDVFAAAPVASTDTVFVDDAPSGGVLRWPAGQAAIRSGTTVVVGRPYPGAPDGFVGLSGASAKISKQHLWIAIGPERARIGRFAAANPVEVGGEALAASGEVEVALPVEISLSKGELVLTLSRS